MNRTTYLVLLGTAAFCCLISAAIANEDQADGEDIQIHSCRVESCAG